MKANQTSTADILIKHSEFTEELSDLQRDYAENDEFLRSMLQKNIDNFNYLVQFVPHLHPGFDAVEVLKWVESNSGKA